MEENWRRKRKKMEEEGGRSEGKGAAVWWRRGRVREEVSRMDETEVDS
jgi:hypothetical protein